MSTAVWGILNVTSDSFSDGGQFLEVESAVSQARKMVSEGASVIDVGGESTRPGAVRVSPKEELNRVLPVISKLAAEGITVSVDTMRSEVARQAINSGAKIVNDVSGGKADSQMFGVVAELGCKYVLMHWRGHSDDMDSLANYENVVAEVKQELLSQVELAISAGVQREDLILDPGLGFAKLPTHNWQLLRSVDELNQLGYSLLIGASRKRFLAECLPSGAAPSDRDIATAAVSAYVASKNVSAVRVHDVAGSVAAIEVAERLTQWM